MFDLNVMSYSSLLGKYLIAKSFTSVTIQKNQNAFAAQLLVLLSF